MVYMILQALPMPAMQMYTVCKVLVSNIEFMSLLSNNCIVLFYIWIIIFMEQGYKE